MALGLSPAQHSQCDRRVAWIGMAFLVANTLWMVRSDPFNGTTPPPDSLLVQVAAVLFLQASILAVGRGRRWGFWVQAVIGLFVVLPLGATLMCNGSGSIDGAFLFMVVVPQLLAGLYSCWRLMHTVELGIGGNVSRP
jgi:hypothetical protein